MLKSPKYEIVNIIQFHEGEEIWQIKPNGPVEMLAYSAAPGKFGVTPYVWPRYRGKAISAKHSAWLTF